MSTTTKLKLKLIDENSVISTTDLNENYGIMEAALDTTLDEVTSGTLIDYNTINNNFQTIDDEWIDTSVANATNATILSGKTAFVNKVKLTGTMTNHGAVTAALNAGGSYTIPTGYHNGSGKVTANSLSSQTVANATAARILNGYTAYVNGTKITGTMASQGAVNTTINAGGSYTVPAGYHNGSGKVYAANLASQTSANATAARILNGYTAYVNGTKITGNIVTRNVNSLTHSGAVVTVPAGYYPSQMNKTIAYANQATPSISVNTSTGLITTSATQTAGFVNAGTKNATSQLTTKAATTITPSTTNQTAVAANVYTTGAIKVLGDADLKASNIKSGVNIFGVTGTYIGAIPTTTNVSSISYNSSSGTIRFYIPGITATSKLLNISAMFDFYLYGTQTGYINGVIYHDSDGSQWVFVSSDAVWQHYDWGALWQFTIANGYIEIDDVGITAGSPASSFTVFQSGVCYI